MVEILKIDQGVIKKILTLKTPAIIAVSGFGGAGKSTFSGELSGLIKASVICVDQFGVDRAIEDYTHWAGMDFDKLEKEVLVPFSEGKSGGVSNSDFLIIEGVGLFRPELLKYFTYKIWIDCPQGVANARGKKRDREVHKNPQDEKWDGPWKRNDDEYFNTYKPRDIADLVIYNI